MWSYQPSLTRRNSVVESTILTSFFVVAEGVLRPSFLCWSFLLHFSFALLLSELSFLAPFSLFEGCSSKNAQVQNWIFSDYYTIWWLKRVSTKVTKCRNATVYSLFDFVT